jgi:hypothetical protein
MRKRRAIACRGFSHFGGLAGPCTALLALLRGERITPIKEHERNTLRGIVLFLNLKFLLFFLSPLVPIVLASVNPNQIEPNQIKSNQIRNKTESG